MIFKITLPSPSINHRVYSTFRWLSKLLSTNEVSGLFISFTKLQNDILPACLLLTRPVPSGVVFEVVEHPAIVVVIAVARNLPLRRSNKQPDADDAYKTMPHIWGSTFHFRAIH